MVFTRLLFLLLFLLWFPFPGFFLTCFTNICPDNATLCLKICESHSKSCVRVGAIELRFPFPARIVLTQLGCSSNPCNSSHLTTCVTDIRIKRQSCCCSDDYCNKPGGKTDEIADLMKPKFCYRLTPIEPLPTIERGREEKYN